MRPLTPTARCTSFGADLQRHIHSYRGWCASRYYEGGVSSVFLWDLDDGGFAGVVLLKKGT